MKETINGQLHLTEQAGLSILIKVARQLFNISDEIETVISGEKLEDDIFNSQLFQIADTIRDNANSLVPIIGTVAIG